MVCVGMFYELVRAGSATCLMTCASVLALCAFPTLAQPAFDLGSIKGTYLSASEGEGAPQISFLALEGLTALSQPDEAISHSGYRAFRPKEIYELDNNKALWLKFRVKSEGTAQSRWTLRTPKTFLDRLELHYRDAQGKWQTQQAGDNIAHHQWTHQTLSPQFILPLMPSGQHEMLIKVVQGYPQQIPLELQDEKTALLTNQAEFLKAGMIVGLLFLILLLSLHLAINYRDAVYAWYALYVLFSILSIASYLGLASYMLWPRATSWPEKSVLTLILASVICQLWFCQTMFLREMPTHKLRTVSKFTALIAVACLPILLSQLTVSARITVFSIAITACFLAIGLILAQAILNKMQAVYFWLLAYTPLLVTVGLALVDNLSYVDPLGLPFALPGYSLTLEAVILLFALHMHAKSRHALQERERVMASIDPLTGFLNASTFNQRLVMQWSRLIGTSQDMALALIYVHHRSDVNDAESALRLEKKLLRSVRFLNTITRDIDLIGRVGGNVLALAMPGIPIGEDLNNRLARLIALGMMTDPYDTIPVELHFRIAVSTRATWGDDLRALDNSLRGTVMETAGWSRKPIRYVAAAPAPAPLPQASRSPLGAVAKQAHRAALREASATGLASSGSTGDPPALNRLPNSDHRRSSGAGKV